MQPNRSGGFGDRASFLLRWARFIDRLGERYQDQEGVIGLFFRSGLVGPAAEDLGELTDLIAWEAPDLRMAAASLLQRTVRAVETLGPEVSKESGDRLASPFGDTWLATPEESEVAALADLVELEAPHLEVPVARVLQVASMVDERIVSVVMSLAEVQRDLQRIVPGSTLAALAAHSDLRRLLTIGQWSSPSDVLGEDHAVAEDLVRLARARAARARGGEKVDLLWIADKLERRSARAGLSLYWRGAPWR